MSWHLVATHGPSFQLEVHLADKVRQQCRDVWAQGIMHYLGVHTGATWKI